jgi:hypothetical protein
MKKFKTYINEDYEINKIISEEKIFYKEKKLSDIFAKNVEKSFYKNWNNIPDHDALDEAFGKLVEEAKTENETPLFVSNTDNTSNKFWLYSSSEDNLTKLKKIFNDKDGFITKLKETKIPNLKKNKKDDSITPFSEIEYSFEKTGKGVEASVSTDFKEFHHCLGFYYESYGDYVAAANKTKIAKKIFDKWENVCPVIDKANEDLYALANLYVTKTHKQFKKIHIPDVSVTDVVWKGKGKHNIKDYYKLEKKDAIDKGKDNTSDCVVFIKGTYADLKKSKVEWTQNDNGLISSGEGIQFYQISLKNGGRLGRVTGAFYAQAPTAESNDMDGLIPILYEFNALGFAKKLIDKIKTVAKNTFASIYNKIFKNINAVHIKNLQKEFTQEFKKNISESLSEKENIISTYTEFNKKIKDINDLIMKIIKFSIGSSTSFDCNISTPLIANNVAAAKFKDMNNCEKNLVSVNYISLTIISKWLNENLDNIANTITELRNIAMIGDTNFKVWKIDAAKDDPELLIPTETITQGPMADIFYGRIRYAILEITFSGTNKLRCNRNKEAVHGWYGINLLLLDEIDDKADKMTYINYQFVNAGGEKTIAKKIEASKKVVYVGGVRQ